MSTPGPPTRTVSIMLLQEAFTSMMKQDKVGNISRKKFWC